MAENSGISVEIKLENLNPNLRRKVEEYMFLCKCEDFESLETSLNINQIDLNM